MSARAIARTSESGPFVEFERAPNASATTLTVERGLQVLRAFRAESTPLGNVDLVRRTGLSKATVSRITSTLRRLGYITKELGGRQFQLATQRSEGTTNKTFICNIVHFLPGFTNSIRRFLGDDLGQCLN